MKRERALAAAEKRQQSNQQRGVGHVSNLEARQRRLEQQERKAILSGQANQPGGLTVSYYNLWFRKAAESVSPILVKYLWQK